MKEQIDQEKDNAQEEMDGIMAYNPRKIIPKVLNNLDIIRRKIDNADDDGNGGRWINRITYGNPNAMYDEVYELLGNLKEQVENKLRWKK